MSTEYKKTCRVPTAGPGTGQGCSVFLILRSCLPDSMERSFPEVALSLPEDDVSSLGSFADAPHGITCLSGQVLPGIREGDSARCRPVKGMLGTREVWHAHRWCHSVIPSQQGIRSLGSGGRMPGFELLASWIPWMSPGLSFLF